MLSVEDIDLLRRSFRDVARTRTATVMLFYDRLFVIAPETRRLFPVRMEEQGAKMMSTLGVIVAQLHALDAMRPMLADLAGRHVGYGVEPAHYRLVGEALIWALAESLGDKFPPPVESAWRRAYAALAETMLAAAPPPSLGDGKR